MKKTNLVIIISLFSSNFMYANATEKTCSEYLTEAASSQDKNIGATLGSGFFVSVIGAMAGSSVSRNHGKDSSTVSKNAWSTAASVAVSAIGTVIYFGIKKHNINEMIALLSQAEKGEDLALQKAYKKFTHKYKEFAEVIHKADVSGEGCRQKMDKQTYKRSIYLENTKNELVNEEMIESEAKLKSVQIIEDKNIEQTKQLPSTNGEELK